VHEVIALLALAAALTAAIARPSWAPESVVALVGAAACLAAGALSWADATAEARAVAPTLALLAALLALGDGCRRAGVFSAVADRLARGARGSPPRLLALVFGAAASTTALLGLDATVVLLTPAVLAAAARLRMSPRPHLYACTHLANSASLVLPVSNLTNLLAFSASGLSFARFAAVMTAPWLLACTLDWAGLRIAFRRDLATVVEHHPPLAQAPRYSLAVLALTVVGFGASTAVSISPAWAALAGCLALAIPQLRRREASPWSLLKSASLGFCAFVLCMGMLVAGVLEHGVESGLRHLIPSGTGLLALLGVAFVAAVLANLANNLPSTLALLPLVSGSPLAVLAVLVGVNIGPNATYPGSLATLLWRRSLAPPDKPRALEFHALGLLSTPIIVAAVTTMLWLVAAPLGLR
jgi:arsenical pump membrane protein